MVNNVKYEHFFKLKPCYNVCHTHLSSLNMKIIVSCFTLMILLASCASDPIDPLDPTLVNKDELQPQCPAGYEPIYSTEIVIKPTDGERKTGKPRKTYKCEPIK